MNVSGGGELEHDLEVLAAGQPVERDRTGEVSFAEPDVGSLINKERKGSSYRHKARGGGKPVILISISTAAPYCTSLGFRLLSLSSAAP